MKYLGIDTSNYTTSCAVFDGKSVINKKIMLSVKEGERGLRQSEAVFQHTVNLPKIIADTDITNPDAVGVSVMPVNTEGSYMPCFLAGKSVAVAIASSCSVPLYYTSHQTGHILAALYSADKLDFVSNKFLAFHLSGGTTEALLVSPDNDNIIKTEVVSSSLDLKAGQAIDRAGVLLGITFPCGKKLDDLSLQSSSEYVYKPSVIGYNCSMSGIENKTVKLIEQGTPKEDVAKFVLTCVAETVKAMLDGIYERYGELPVIFSGGVSSNTLLRKIIGSKYSNVFFAEPEFSLDNAVGCAIYAYMKDRNI